MSQFTGVNVVFFNILFLRSLLIVFVSSLRTCLSKAAKLGFFSLKCAPIVLSNTLSFLTFQYQAVVNLKFTTPQVIA